MKVIIIDHDNVPLTMEMTTGVISESIPARTHGGGSATQAISGQCFKIDYLLKDVCFHYLKPVAERPLTESLSGEMMEKWKI